MYRKILVSYNRTPHSTIAEMAAQQKIDSNMGDSALRCT